MNKRIATIIVGRRRLLRERLTSFLQHTVYEVVANVPSPSEFEDAPIPVGRALLIIVEIDGAQENFDEDAQAVRRLRSLFPGSKLLLVADRSDPLDIQRIAALGADGCILNPTSRGVLLKAVELIFLKPQLFVWVQPSPRAGDYAGYEASATAWDAEPGSVASLANELSPREQYILGFLAQGLSNRTIARLSNITELTVKVHLKAIMRKAGVDNRTQAAVWAVASGYRSLSIADHQQVQKKRAPVKDTLRTLLMRS